ncbi:nitrogen regulation protein NR(II) [Melaminivora sp.]|uniref:nitrogen regulation protein NR(II) n=1 Tax=Melaminivora sp. TaxID=1933032 RepID=UPI0028ACAE16|nr:nitrogen regulation protein NR(II) [Melaminivora sp.]
MPAAPAQGPAAGRYHPLDWLGTLVAVLRGDGRIVFANAALEAALALSRRTLEGADFSGLLSEPQVLRTALEGARAHGFATLRFQAALRTPAGEALAVHASLAAAQEGADELLLELWPVCGQDRSERLREQGEAQRELVRNLAHEIKNPLGGIRGSAQLLELELADPALAEYTQVIVRETDRLQALVDRLLAPHRHGQRLAPVNIHEVCEHVRALVLAEHPQGLEVLRDYDTSLPELHGDREQLVQALLNIVRNAAQVLDEQSPAQGGRITLRTRVSRQPVLGRQRHRLALQLEVLDNGPGIPAELRERIFLPLVTGRDAGTGLGLTLAQAFVQRHDGIIECDSAPGCTRFAILLPLP